jgi:hypothetical protein
MLSGLNKNAPRLRIVKENYSSTHSASKQGTKYWPCTTQFCEFVPSSNILLLNKLGCLPHLKVSMAR